MLLGGISTEHTFIISWEGYACVECVLASFRAGLPGIRGDWGEEPADTLAAIKRSSLLYSVSS